MPALRHTGAGRPIIHAMTDHLGPATGSPDDIQRPSRFTDDVLRLIAAVCVGYGALHLIEFIVNLAQSRGSPLAFGFPIQNRPLAQSLQFAWGGIGIVQLIGGIALFLRKTWGRILLLVWGIGSPMISLVNVLLYLSWSARTLAATTQPAAAPPFGYLAWRMLVSWLGWACVPVIVVILLRHRAIRDLWAKAPARAFEVLPALPISPEEPIDV